STGSQPRSDDHTVHSERNPRTTLLSRPLLDRCRNRRRPLFRRFENGNVLADPRPRLRTGSLWAIFNPPAAGQTLVLYSIQEQNPGVTTMAERLRVRSPVGERPDRQAWNARRYGTGSGSDLLYSEWSLNGRNSSLPLPVPYQCRMFSFSKQAS